MQTKLFRIHDLQELRVLQRVFREAKFCLEADDAEVSSSPLVADLFERVIEALIETQVALEGDSARERWIKWLRMSDTTRDEWHAAMRRAEKNVLWSKMTSEEKFQYVVLLFRPFVLEKGLIEKFIMEVDSRCG